MQHPAAPDSTQQHPRARSVAIALGSNLGNRDAAIAFAVERLSAILTGLRVSEVIETWPVGEGTDNQNLYLNAVVVGETDLSPRALLDPPPPASYQCSKIPFTLPLSFSLPGKDPLVPTRLESSETQLTSSGW